MFWILKMQRVYSQLLYKEGEEEAERGKEGLARQKSRQGRGRKEKRKMENRRKDRGMEGRKGER